MRQISKPVSGSDREFRGIVQARIKKPADTVHLERRHERVPVRDAAPRAGPRMLIETGKAKGVGDQRSSGNVRSRHYPISYLLRIERLAIETQLRIELPRPPTVQHCADRSVADA